MKQINILKYFLTCIFKSACNINFDCWTYLFHLDSKMFTFRTETCSHMTNKNSPLCCWWHSCGCPHLLTIYMTFLHFYSLTGKASNYWAGLGKGEECRKEKKTLQTSSMEKEPCRKTRKDRLARSHSSCHCSTWLLICNGCSPALSQLGKSSHRSCFSSPLAKEIHSSPHFLGIKTQACS